MARIFSGTYSSGIVLSNPATQNPATVAATGYVTNPTTSYGAEAVNGTTAAAWNFTNLGTIEGTGTLSAGVGLFAGGNVTNASIGALISGSKLGVFVEGTAGTVSNFGTIKNTGTRGAGIALFAGGTVTNASSGIVLSLQNGVEIDSSAGTVSNLGTIKGTGTGSSGVVLFAGGSVTNASTAALITGVLNSVFIGGSAGTVSNLGTIKGTGTGSSGVVLFAGGSVTNASTAALIEGGGNAVNISGGLGTVSNLGTINATAAGRYGVYLIVGGSVTNSQSGLIAGALSGVGVLNGSGTVANSGTISGAYYGISLGAGNIANDAGTVSNSGTIEGTGTRGSGVGLAAGGSVTNGASGSTAGLITGVSRGIFFGGAGTVNSGTVVNYGTIAGTGTSTSAGVELEVGGSVTNGANDSTTALIRGNTGIKVSGSAGTITNFGTIAGTGGIAIRLGAGNDRIVIEQGSSLKGAVANFLPGDTFDLPFLSFSSNGTVTLGAANVLKITENGSSFAIDLDPTQNFTGDFFHLASDGAGGTLVTEDTTPPPTGTVDPVIVPGGTISQHFAATDTWGNLGTPPPGYENSTLTHPAVDIVAPLGTEVDAFASGIVIGVNFSTALGWYVLVQDSGTADSTVAGGKDFYTLYLHLQNQPLVTINQNITAGLKIGEVGTTGNEKGVPAGDGILHFEIRLFPDLFQPYTQWNLPTRGSNIYIFGPQTPDQLLADPQNTGLGYINPENFISENDVTLPAEPQSTLPVATGGTGTISTNFLSSYDPDNTAAKLTYTVDTAPTHGTLLLNGVATTSFTQADLDNGLVQYRENGDVVTSDGFTFTVSDPAGNKIGPEPYTIAIVNTTAPVIEANTTLSASVASSTMIWTNSLSTVALGNDPAELTYSVVTTPVHGTLLVNGASANSFTQAEIDDHRVQYRENGDAASSDSFTFTVSDRAGDHTATETFNLALLAQFAAAGFATASDQGAGTLVNYTPPQTGTTDPTLLTIPQH